MLLSLFFAWHISGIPQEKALKPQNVNLEKAEFRGYEINGNHFLIKEARPFIKYKMQSSKNCQCKSIFCRTSGAGYRCKNFLPDQRKLLMNRTQEYGLI